VIFLSMLLRATTSSLLPEWLGAALALVALCAAALALAAAVGRLAT